MSDLRLYAGIGSRKTPMPVCQTMTELARQLSSEWKLRSGYAYGADMAFERGAKEKEIHLPFAGYNNKDAGGDYIIPKPTIELCDIAYRHHPKWDDLSNTVKLLMMRNTSIMLGALVDAPVEMVVCWTPNGAEVGGTSHALRIAKTFNIPVFNLAIERDRSALVEFVR